MNETALRYRRFAGLEAAGVSASYERLALGAAADAGLLALIEELPGPKRQPNLVFAAGRWLGAPVAEYDAFREFVLVNWAEVRGIILARSTQTNEAGRCAAFLPQLSRIDGPLALLEVGAAAGLCLYPDRYSYRYETPEGTVELDPPAGRSSVALECEIDESVALPARLPEVLWRGGIDLNPIDIRDEESLNWLETLVWPEHDTRRRRLRAAAALVAAEPPLLVEGNLLEELPRMLGEVPAGITPVVFHSAVMAYLTPQDREEFRMMVGELGAVWISNEGIGSMPSIAARLPADLVVQGEFVLAVDGEPVALTGPHGQFYRSLRLPPVRQEAPS